MVGTLFLHFYSRCNKVGTRVIRSLMSVRLCACVCAFHQHRVHNFQPISMKLVGGFHLVNSSVKFEDERNIFNVCSCAVYCKSTYGCRIHNFQPILMKLVLWKFLDSLALSSSNKCAIDANFPHALHNANLHFERRKGSREGRQVSNENILLFFVKMYE